MTRAVVLVSLEPWDDVWRRNQHLAAGLLRRDPGLRLLVVEPPVDVAHGLRRGTLPRPGRGLRQGPALDGVEPGRLWLYEPTKVLPRRVARRGDRRRDKAVVRAARRAGLQQPTAWINDPRAAGLLDASGWPAVYDVTDDWVAADRPPAERARLVHGEDVLLWRAAAVTVCSPALADRKAAAGPVLVTNGVDVARYRRPAPRPADLPAAPVALYVGTLHRDRLDLAVCLATAAALAGRGGSLVAVGPVALAGQDVALLEGAGVVLLGARPYTEVPAYLQHADALVVPHVVDEFTDSLDPLKLYEYLAVGRPVVSTPVAGFRDRRDPAVRVAEPGEFPAAVADAAAGTHATRKAPADLPTWERQVGLFGDVLDAVADHARALRS
ncbi:MAG: glycosyltransferase [Promicromonosporaceae bacterium]|nr:glycosyltransferase [Promicromonosporaceae bacterium]